MTKLTCAKRPCGSCPYRQDVPSGVWARDEYEKLVAYDRDMAYQPVERFDCHQRDGHLCAGWVATHGAENLLALRIIDMTSDLLDKGVYRYRTDVEVFASGQRAYEHGIGDIEDPGIEAMRLMRKLQPILGGRDVN